MSRHPVRIQLRRSESGRPDKGAQVTYMTPEEVQRLRQTGYEPAEVIYEETRPCPPQSSGARPSLVQCRVWRAMDEQGLLDVEIASDAEARDMDQRIIACFKAHLWEVPPPSLRDIWRKLHRADRKRQRGQ